MGARFTGARFTRLARRLSVALVLAVVVSSCAQAPGGAAQGPRPTVRVGALPFAQYTATFYVGEKWIQDCFGLSVEVTRFSAAVAAAEALRAGQIDITFGGIFSFLPSYVAGVPLYLVGALGYGGYRFVRRPDVQIADYGDLKGKRVGLVRGALELLDTAAFQKAGLTFSDQPGKADVTLVFLPGVPDIAQAIAQKQIDAAIQSEPVATQMLAQGSAVEVKKPYDTSLGKISKVVTMSKDFYDKKDAAQRFMNAFVYATSWLDAHPDVRQKFTIERIFDGQLSAKDYADSVANAANGVDLTSDEVQKTADLMFQTGQMKTQVAAKDVVRLDLLEAAKVQAAGAKCQQP